jgi:signal transduction histidine kinase
MLNPIYNRFLNPHHLKDYKFMNLPKVKSLFNSAVINYGGALVLVIAALLMTLLLWSLLVKPVSSPLFLGAIAISAWLFGFRPGVLASVTSGILLDYFFVAPLYEFSANQEEVMRVIVFVAEGTFLSWLISARRAAIEEIRNSREQLLALSLHQQTVREAEQKRISLEIHDELGQALTGMKMEVHWLKRRINEQNENKPQPQLTEKLTDLSNLIDTTIVSVRRISTELRPAILDDFGLVAAIEWQAREFERKNDVPCLLKSDVEKLDLNTESTTAVFRVFQEALTNVTRHAHASCVKVNLKSLGEQILMSIEDNGIGIDLSKIKTGKSLGVLGMRERTRLIGGTLNIFEGDKGGTTVELTFPLAINYPK